MRSRKKDLPETINPRTALLWIAWPRKQNMNTHPKDPTTHPAKHQPKTKTSFFMK
ncbi:hypothetical protein [Vulcanisaeta thermophila]|uniref:hypothetical protein n=1 Tax=Vulcanisaeta thermophila TaxID=867917 RepID=UPI001389790B|nr:hypothetical protein [Vulcanisaeta thermophila]